MRHQILGTMTLALFCSASPGLGQDNAAPTEVNADVNTGATAAATTAEAAPKPAASPYELRYRFDQDGTLPRHTFVLKWSGPTSNLQSIDVLVSDSTRVIQTIQIPQQQVHLVWQEILSKPGATKDRIVDLVDYNFDKFADLRIVKSWPYKVGEKSYLVWLFDDKQNKYDLSEVFSALPNPSVDAKTKRISSIKLTGRGGGEYEQKVYSVDGSGPQLRLLLQARIVQSSMNGQQLEFLRDIRAREHGEVQRVCKLRIRTEGRPQRLWGTKAACEPYLVKGPPTILHKDADEGMGEQEEPVLKQPGKEPPAKGPLTVVKDGGESLGDEAE